MSRRERARTARERESYRRIEREFEKRNRGMRRGGGGRERLVGARLRRGRELQWEEGHARGSAREMEKSLDFSDWATCLVVYGLFFFLRVVKTQFYPSFILAKSPK